jgi:hypothetical protein
MAQVLASGGGVSFTADGKKLTRQVYVLTPPTTSVTPTAVPGSTITSADFVQEAAGVTRVTVTWTQGLANVGGGGGGDGSGTTVELIGGSREVPIEAHPIFKGVTEEAIREIKLAIQEGRDPNPSLVPNAAGSATRLLYKLLLRGQEFYLAPGVSYRETTLASALPNLNQIATINAPPNAPGVAALQNWLLTSINARSVAQPTGGVRYEVTREWLLSDRNGWDPEGFIYQGS